MKAPVEYGGITTVSAVLRRRLRDMGLSPADLAGATELTVQYINAILAGRRRPPPPDQTDLYPRMTAFLRLSPDYLNACARAEREVDARSGPKIPSARTRRLLLRLCERTLARTLEQRRVQFGGAELTGAIQRLVDVAKGVVGRELADSATLRRTTERAGGSYPGARAERLEFMDCGLDTLSRIDIARFVRAHIQHWDMDLKTGALRIVLYDRRPR